MSSKKKSSNKAKKLVQNETIENNELDTNAKGNESSNVTTKKLTKRQIREQLLKQKEEEEKEQKRLKPFEGGATFGKRLELSTIMFALVAAMFAIFFFKLGNHDSDFLWHSALGSYIMETDTIPKTDIFSWIGIEKELPYTAHSWMFSMIASSFAEHMGAYAGAYTMSAIGAFFLFLFVKTTLFPRRNFFTFLLSLLIGFICANPRPGVWGYVLFVYTLLILQKSLEKKDAKSWLTLPIISFIWVNLHGGTILILFCIELLYAMLGILPNFKIGFVENNTAVSGDLSLLKLKKEDGTHKTFSEYKEDLVTFNKYAFKSYWIKSFLIIALSIVFALFNPYGFKTIIWGFTENSSVTKMFISEWQPISLGETFVIMVIGILIVYTLMFYKKGIKLHKILPMICCLGAAAIYQRFVVYAILASFIPLSEIIKKLNIKGWITWKWYAIVTPIVLALVIFTGTFKNENANNYELDKELDTYLDEANLERPYNEHNQGGKLIYAGHKTFIDQRFTDDIMIDGILLQSLQAQDGKTVEGVIEEMNFDSFIISKKDKSQLILYLELQPDKWKIDFDNDNYIVFVKNEVVQNNN